MINNTQVVFDLLIYYLQLSTQGGWPT